MRPPARDRPQPPRHLPGHGVCRGKTSLVQKEGQAGVVVLTGQLPSGRKARFEVQLDGQLSYDLDGYEDRPALSRWNVLSRRSVIASGSRWDLPR